MNSTVAKVKAADLFDAFECLDFGDFDDGLEDQERLSEDEPEFGRFLALPHKNELGLGRDLGLSFIEEAAPGGYDQIPLTSGGKAPTPASRISSKAAR